MMELTSNGTFVVSLSSRSAETFQVTLAKFASKDGMLKDGRKDNRKFSKFKFI